MLREVFSCKMKSDSTTISISVYSISLNVLSVPATLAAVVYTLPVAVPIVMGVSTLALLAYNIYQVYLRIHDVPLKDRWKAIFTDIVQAKYADAHQKVEKILNFPSDSAGIDKKEEVDR